ncbi:DTW domain-containing protein YfiP [Halopseudomonas litoralis]|uniref:tRNA-uridine aminocarboxypropyltransferase n=1 Tax=Halopseudomonas litoralis TaxID=797277 RepID=A0A1H1T4V6_9GAMM|nr:tRNA-uridine aminocarboxypropyltransferase [Halopseudomonas litoralis]SDS55046.1 DTW domain-containing protein YfiP [Halopseudomonas litoralis]
MSPPSQSHTVRPRCPRCGRPVELCLCHLLPNLTPRTEILVIQHPDERRHALNTARLLVAGLSNAHLLIAEQLPPDWVERIADRGWRTELLFPGPQVPLLTAAGQGDRPRRLVLLDGTWRKARKLLYLNPLLQQLSQVALPEGLTSRYRLRKAPATGALSTIEAGTMALQMIEPETDFADLLRPFDALIDGQIRAMGEDIYTRNYRRNEL